MVIHSPLERLKLIDNILPISPCNVLMKSSEMMNLSHQFSVFLGRQSEEACNRAGKNGRGIRS